MKTFLLSYFKKYPMTLALVAIGLFVSLSYPREFSMSGQAFGTFYQIKGYKHFFIPQRRLRQDIQTRLSELDQQFSTYRKDSLITQINQASSGERIQITDDFKRVFLASDYWVRVSSSQFNPSKKPVSDLWDVTGLEPYFPTLKERELANERSDWSDFSIDAESIQKAKSTAVLDFSAIAKGYAVDELFEILESANLESIYINIGGELRVKGEKPDHKSWVIGIQDPRDLSKIYKRMNLMSPVSVATSGTYQQYFEWNNRVYSHIIDPATAAPVQKDILSVSVFSNDCMSADALATALLVMGSQEAIQFSRDQKLRTYILYETDQGIRTYYSTALLDGLNSDLDTFKDID